jgi:hypothetical protein
MNNKLFLKIFLLLVIFMVFASSTQAQYNRARKDGLWWTKIETKMKELYLVGYISGMTLGYRLTTDLFPEKSKCKTTAKNWFDNVTIPMAGTKLSQIAVRIDSLYKDTTNLALTASRSVWIVTAQLLDFHPDFIKSIISEAKKADCIKFKSIQELMDYKEPY